MQLTINSQTVDAQPGQTILEAARAHGIEIPTLCYHRDLSPVGSCRLCLVHVAGLPAPVPACATSAETGMVIQIETPELTQHRKLILEMLLSDYWDSGYVPADRAATEFQHWIRHYAAERPSWAAPEPRYRVDSDPNPFVWVDLNKCILCTRCVRACAEVQGRFVWGVAGRGRDAKIAAGTDTDMLDARCESCGACAAYCPTGALDDRMAISAGRPDRLVTTTCPYCGVGCRFDLNVKDDRIIRVTSNPAAPVNGMSLCVKGRYGIDFVDHPDRLTKPRVRQYLLNGQRRPIGNDRGQWIEVDWDQALNLVADKLTSICHESGPDAIGLLSSAKCSNEENYLMQKFARQVLGTHNIDHCARLCHSSTVAGLAMSFGSGAMSNSMDDVAQHAAAFFIIGSNTTEQHPVFGTMIRQAVLRRGAKLVVADPRKIDIAEFATLHVRQRPGTDVALLNGLMHIIVKNCWHDTSFIADRCEGFDEFARTIDNYTPEYVAQITGVGESELHEAAKLLSAHRPMAAIWAMGITQHTTGVLNVLSLANLQMLLGNMGVPGGGVNPLRGQNNVQGACDMGALPNVFTGYQSVTDAAVRAKFEAAWALEPDPVDQAQRVKSMPRLAGQSGLTVTEMIPATGDGTIRAIFILGENPVLTDPDSNHVRRCLSAAEFVVLQEIFPSETSVYADVLLPGTSFAERSGTFTNTERRIQLFRQAIAPRGESKPDWSIISDLARRILLRQGRKPAGPHAGWCYADPADIMKEIAALTPSYAGVSYDRLERDERLQWPVTGPGHPGTPILHVGTFARGKGRFHGVDYLPAAELPDSDYPLLLTTGRVLYHWHGGEMTRRAQGLSAAFPQNLIELSPDDAARLNVADHQPVRVRSRRGKMDALVWITNRVSPGLVFGNFHFPGLRNVNNLTINALDPIAKIPEYKVCAVRIEAMATNSNLS
jgi:formate dehydrogenase alpha subunit